MLKREYIVVESYLAGLAAHEEFRIFISQQFITNKLWLYKGSHYNKYNSLGVRKAGSPFILYGLIYIIIFTSDLWG